MYWSKQTTEYEIWHDVIHITPWWRHHMTSQYDVMFHEPTWCFYWLFFWNGNRVWFLKVFRRRELIQGFLAKFQCAVQVFNHFQQVFIDRRDHIKTGCWFWSLVRNRGTLSNSFGRLRFLSKCCRFLEIWISCKCLNVLSKDIQMYKHKFLPNVYLNNHI